MKHIFYDNKAPDSFEEHLEFNYHIPYSIRVKKFTTEDIVPLHYGETIEILICENLEGNITIDSKAFTLGGEQLFVIPPGIVHTNAINSCGGTMYVLKVSFEAMSDFVNLPAIMEYSHKNFSQLSFTCPEYDIIYKHTKALIKKDGDLFACLAIIINIFDVLKNYTEDSVYESNVYILKNSSLHELIKWTQGNFNRKISLDDVAKKVGYSKCYFCNKFKAITGTTYLDYLNSVRLAHAHLLLHQNIPISEVCYACGFENTSYFIQLFKKIYGFTPKKYLKMYKNINHE